MSSPFTDYANATLNFQVASGTLTPDSKGNMKPGTAIVEVEALLQQKKDRFQELTTVEVLQTLIIYPILASTW